MNGITFLKNSTTENGIFLSIHVAMNTKWIKKYEVTVWKEIKKNDV